LYRVPASRQFSGTININVNWYGKIYRKRNRI
jgi:hypothetical protein